jgi:hypothetical protein
MFPPFLGILACSLIGGGLPLSSGRVNVLPPNEEQAHEEERMANEGCPHDPSAEGGADSAN